MEKRFVERSRKQCLFSKNKVSNSFCPTFRPTNRRIFGGFPQLSVSLINEKTEITHSRLSVTGRHRSCAKSRHEKADWIVVGSFFFGRRKKTRIGKKKVHVTDARMGFSQVRASGRSETATRSRCSPRLVGTRHTARRSALRPEPRHRETPRASRPVSRPCTRGDERPTRAASRSDRRGAFGAPRDRGTRETR